MSEAVHFGLIVTGKGEHQFLPTFLGALGRTGAATFEVIRKTSQRSPIISQQRRLKMVGEGKIIPSEDENEIGIPARQFMALSPSHCVILIDDLEHSAAEQANEKLGRYRIAIDALLTRQPEFKIRAAVHFLVNMLEAYYFADAQAIQKHFNFPIQWVDYPGDVETIVHPKGDLNALCNQYVGRVFHEIDDGWAIIRRLDLNQVLSNPNTCAWLRTLFAWCIEKMIQCHYGLELTLENLTLLQEIEPDFYQMIDDFHLTQGRYAPAPQAQLVYFGKAAA